MVEVLPAAKHAQAIPSSTARYVRRQFQSCDGCRRSRKACDAGQLGIIGHGSCTLCRKKGRVCSFDWLAARKQQHRRNDKTDATRRRSVTGSELQTEVKAREGIDLFSADWSIDERQGDLNLDWFSEDVLEPCNPTAFLASTTRSGEHFSGLQSTNASFDGGVPYNTSPPTSGESVVGSQDRRQSDHFQSLAKPFRNQLGADRYGQPLNNSLAMSVERDCVTDVFVRIYMKVVEHALSCWSTVKNCPYTVALQTDDVSRARKTPWSGCSTYYERACRMDQAAQSLGLQCYPRLTVSQDKLASQALQKVILAFAIQWDGESSQDNSNSDFLDSNHSLAQQLRSTLKKTLWNDAQTALHAAAGVNSIRLVFARLIFSFISSPFEAKGSSAPSTAEAYCSGSFSTNSGSVSQESEDGAHGIDEDPCQEVFDSQKPLVHLETALRHLLHLRQRLQTELKSRERFPTDNSELEDSFLTDFNMLFWLGVMCDTTVSAVTGRTLVVSDEDSAVRHSPGIVDGASTSLGDDVAGDRRKCHQGPACAESPSKPRSLWRGRLLDQPTIPAEVCQRWPLADDLVARILEEAIPVKVNIFRHIARLQSGINHKSSAHEIEIVIKDAFLVYQEWQTKYGAFMANCTQDSDRLRPTLQAWHVILAAHWHYGAMLLSERILALDKEGLGEYRCRVERQETMVLAEMSLSNAFSVAQLASTCAKARKLAAIYSSENEDAPAMLSEPWCEIMIRALSKAATILIQTSTAVEYIDPGIPYASRVVDRGHGSEGIKACIKALKHLSSRCDSAGIIADMLQQKFEIARPEVHAGHFAQLRGQLVTV